MNTMGFVKGMAAGMVVGAAAALIMDPISSKQRNRIKRKTEGVFKSIGGVIDTAMDIMR